jgi:hypothetical protein
MIYAKAHFAKGNKGVKMRQQIFTQKQQEVLVLILRTGIGAISTDYAQTLKDNKEAVEQLEKLNVLYKEEGCLRVDHKKLKEYIDSFK